MSKKDNLPTVRALRDAVSKEKKTIDGESTHHVRVRVYADRWDVDGGAGQFLVDDKDTVLLAVTYAAMDRYANSENIAKRLIISLRAQLMGLSETKPGEQAHEVAEKLGAPLYVWADDELADER